MTKKKQAVERAPFGIIDIAEQGAGRKAKQLAEAQVEDVCGWWRLFSLSPSGG